MPTPVDDDDAAFSALSLVGLLADRKEEEE